MEGRIEFLNVQDIASVAFQGERGAYSEQAALIFFKKTISLLPTPTFKDVFELVERRKADSGIIPIENSLHGSVLENYDLLFHHRLSIVGEVTLRVVHYLLAMKKTSLRSIRRVYSHPQALAQCRSFLQKLHAVEVIPTYDTAGAAKLIKEKHLANAAAIASAQAAKVYGLKIVARGVENNRANYTRFIVLARRPVFTTNSAKTSVIFGLRNVPGSLHKALRVFASRRINLLKIESRPIVGRPWEYLFHLDFDGSLHEERCSQALEELRKATSSLTVLGSYPKAEKAGR
jgi:prephenate dehydratase